MASSGGTAVLDGDNGPGPAVAHRAMTEAIGGANRHGDGEHGGTPRQPPRLGGAHFASLALPHQMSGIAISGRILATGPGTGCVSCGHPPGRARNCGADRGNGGAARS